jgi:hypothetical protein
MKGHWSWSVLINSEGQAIRDESHPGRPVLFFMEPPKIVNHMIKVVSVKEWHKKEQK